MSLYFASKLKARVDILVRLPNSQQKLVPVFYGRLYTHYYKKIQGVQRKFLYAHFPVDLRPPL